MRQRKLTDQQRIDAVTAYLAGAGSYQAVAEQFQISSRTLRDLVALYQYHGPDALKSSVTNNTYPPELKRQAVEEYQSGQGTQRDICLPRPHPAAQLDPSIWQRRSLVRRAPARQSAQEKNHPRAQDHPRRTHQHRQPLSCQRQKLRAFRPYPQRQLSAGVFLGQKI